MVQEEQKRSLLQRSRLKTLTKRTVLFVVVALFLYNGVALLYASKTIYKVRRNYAVILEDLSGQRRVVQDVGWHVRLPLFTRLELEVPLMNQELHLGATAEAQRIMSQGNVALWTSAMLTYRIHDLEQWGVENRSPQSLLQHDFDGIVKDVMQAKTIDELVSGREEVKGQIYQALKTNPINVGGPSLEDKYGIEVVSFVLGDTRFGAKLAEASEEKKRRELIAEAENYAADLEASRIRKLYAAYRESVVAFRDSLHLDASSDSSLFDFLNQQKWATAYEKNQQGQNTFVLNNTSGSPPVVLPSPPALPARAKAPAVQNEKVFDGKTAQNQNPRLRQPLGEADQAD